MTSNLSCVANSGLPGCCFPGLFVWCCMSGLCSASGALPGRWELRSHRFTQLSTSVNTPPSQNLVSENSFSLSIPNMFIKLAVSPSMYRFDFSRGNPNHRPGRTAKNESMEHWKKGKRERRKHLHQEEWTASAVIQWGGTRRLPEGDKEAPRESSGHEALCSAFSPGQPCCLDPAACYAPQVLNAIPFRPKVDIL